MIRGGLSKIIMSEKGQKRKEMKVRRHWQSQHWKGRKSFTISEANDKKIIKCQKDYELSEMILCK